MAGGADRAAILWEGDTPGEVDDVVNVSGHRLGTVELESAIASHPAVTEAAVVGYPHQVKGQGVFACVTLKEGIAETETLRREIIGWVRARIGPIASPDIIHLTKVAANDFQDFGDVSTLAEPAVVEDIVKRRQQALALKETA